MSSDHLIPAYTGPSYWSPASGVQPTGAVGSGKLSPQEATAQAACYLGYLSLCGGDMFPDTDEMQRTYNLIESYLKEGKVVEAMRPLIEKMLAILAPGGNVSEESAHNFTHAYYQDSSTANAIFNWITGKDGYSFNAQTSPETVMAFFTFLVTAGGGTMADPGLAEEVDDYLNQPGEPSCLEIFSEFFVCYLRLHPDFPYHVQLVLKGTGLDNGAFAKIFNGSGPYGLDGWQPPKGVSLQEALQAIVDRFHFYAPGSATS